MKNKAIMLLQRSRKNRTAYKTGVVRRELATQHKLGAELILANKELAYQNQEKESRAAELILANTELAYQNQEKENRATELIIANKELAYQNQEKENRAAELILANTELAYQNQEKENRATELIIANKELAFQNAEKENRAAELILANAELAYQNQEKENRATELIVANTELAYQNQEKENRATELIIANHELIKAKEQFRLVVEAVPNAMVLIDTDGFIVLVNSQTEKLFEYDRRELIGEKLEVLIPERFHHKSIFFKERHLRSMGVDQEVFGLRKSDTEVQVEIELNPIETINGQMVLVSIVDITERRAQEETFKKHNKELEQFAYIASHDLQEPLRTVSNYMEVFEEDYLPLLDEQARYYLRSVNSATERMSVLIKSLLEFSRLGHNKILISVDCRKLIGGVIEDLSTLIKRSGAVIEIDEMPVLKLYEIEMRQVFQNLISNAIKFIHKGTRPEIHISACKISDSWQFSIRDNGIGIATKSYERVFDIFQRLHSTEKYEGSGIGLANCKKIIQLHKGNIWIESLPGQGSTFFFTIKNLII